jgi:hypothetical protein
LDKIFGQNALFSQNNLVDISGLMPSPSSLNYKKINTLDLSYNKIKHISYLTFSRVADLEWLNLALNSIETV